MSRQLHVLIIAQYFPPDMGGGATRAYNVAKGLVLNNCKVTVVTAFPHYPDGNIPREYRWKPFKIEKSEGMTIIRTFVPPLASKGLLRRAILFLSFILSSLIGLLLVKEKIHAIWAANPNIISFFPAKTYSIFKKAPIVLNVDDLWPEDIYMLGLIKEGSFIGKIAETFAAIAYTKSKAITPISPGYIKVIHGKYGIPIKKIHVVRAGVDTTKFKAKRKSRKTKDKKFKVVYSGAFSPAYDFDQVLKAAKLLEEFSDVQIILQGRGELLCYVKKMKGRFKLKNVKIIGRVLKREDVARLLSNADALLLPLRDFGKPYLGISSKLYEYQAMGKPIICCAEGCPSEYVRETQSGITVRPGDYKQLAKAILLLKDNPNLAKKLGENGKKFVASNLTLKSIGTKIKNTFEQVSKC